MSDAARYTYSVMWSPDDEEYVGTIAEMPSLSWLEPSREAALAGIQRLVEEILEDMENEGDPAHFLHNR